MNKKTFGIFAMVFPRTKRRRLRRMKNPRKKKKYWPRLKEN
jgi:hypothetical protein